MYTSLPVNTFPWQNLNAAYLPCTQNVPESRGISMADFMRLNSLQAPQIDLMRSNTPTNLNPSEISFPEQMVRGVHQSTNNDYIMSADNFMNDGTGACSFQNPQASRNIMLMRGNAAGGYQMNRKGGEENSSNINKPQSNINFVGHGRPMLHHTQNNNQNNGEIKTDNSAKVVNADQYGCLEKIDGSFLSLGLGDNTEARSKPYFSTRELPSKLEEAAFPNLRTSHAGHAARSYLGHNLGVSFPNSQNNAGLSIPSHNSGGSTSGYDVGVVRVANTGLSSSPFHILRTPQVDMQQNICNPSIRNLGPVSKGDAAYGNFVPYKGFRGDQPAPSGAYSSSPTAHANSRQIILPELASGSDNHTWFTTGTASNQLQNMESAKSLSLESSSNSPFLGIRGSSGRQGRSGPVFSGLEGSRSQAAGNNQFIRRIGGRPAAFFCS